MSTPVYPKALSSWTPRIDNVDTIWAADPNTLAAEIVSIEQTIGTMPQVESPMPVGNPVTYANLSERVNAAMLQTEHPYAELYASNFHVRYGGPLYVLNYAIPNVFKKVSDNWGYFNGSDITIKAPGLYLIDGFQVWSWYSSGYLLHILTVNDAIVRDDRWDWDFPKSGPNSENYRGHWARTGFSAMIPLNKGDRVRIFSQNSTPNKSYLVYGSSFRIYYLKSLTSSQVGPSTYPS